jgi:arsenate reductase
MINILFLCVHNAGRSQMAAGFVRALNRPDIRVWSGGSAPRDSLNPVAVAAMAECGINISAQQPRTWDHADVTEADIIITMGCGDSCPILPGKRYEDWKLPDPAGQALPVVREIRDEIHRRVIDLLQRLPTNQCDFDHE